MHSNFQVVPIDSITINRPERQRKELKDLEPLARSIQENGLIHPPTVTSDLILIAGERRFTACRDLLGYTHITVSIREEDETTSSQRRLELAENVERLDLDWKDKCHAIREYHNLAVEEDSTWTMEASARALNMGSAVVSRHISLANELDLGTELIVNASQYSVALGIMDRMRERREQASKDKLRDMLGGSTKTEPTSDPLDDVVGSILGTDSAPASNVDTGDLTNEPELEPVSGITPFRCSDFIKFSQAYSGEPYNFLHCDFPYGVNAGKHNSGAAKSFGGYDDSEDVYWELLDALGNSMDTLVSSHAHMMFWYSMDYHAETVARLTSFGWKVNPFPLIWFKSDNSGILPDPKRGPRRNYETALLCTRGDRKIIQAVSNVCPHPNTKHIHMSEKPIGMLRHFFRMFVDDTTSLLDPTMGSGNAVVLAEHLGAARSRGLERDKTFYETARDAYLAGKYDLGEG
ncbi:MAG: hypothetical protein CL484_03205 [Acidobacteria bacterium]|nr:hypothetical protein [Acidobacteriota bacterium]